MCEQCKVYQEKNAELEAIIDRLYRLVAQKNQQLRESMFREIAIAAINHQQTESLEDQAAIIDDLILIQSYNTLLHDVSADEFEV